MAVKGPGTGLVDNKASCLTGAGGHSLLSTVMKKGEAQKGKEAYGQTLPLRQEHRSLGRGAADRKWGEERQRCLLKGAVFVLRLIEKQEEGDLSHVHVSFQAEFKVIPLAHVEKILSPINPNIPAEGTLLSQKWPGNRWEENARYKHLCYRWGGPRMRRRWRKKLRKASPAFELPFGLPSGTFSSSVIKDSLNRG